MSETRAVDEDANERRVAPRIRTLRRARILFNNRYSTIDCVVRNVSTTGALLTVDSVVQLPPTFEIRVGDEGEIRWAKLVYRREMFAGIHFLDDQETVQAVRADGLVRPVGKADAARIERIVPVALPNALRRLFAWSEIAR